MNMRFRSSTSASSNLQNDLQIVRQVPVIPASLTRQAVENLRNRNCMDQQNRNERSENIALVRNCCLLDV